MSRADFGGTSSDFVFGTTVDGLMKLQSATLTMWDAEIDGSQVTDLLWGGSPVTEIPVGSDGQIPTFQGPDGVTQLWASAGGGRVQMLAFAGIAAQVHDDADAVATSRAAVEAIDPLVFSLIFGGN